MVGRFGVFIGVGSFVGGVLGVVCLVLVLVLGPSGTAPHLVTHVVVRSLVQLMYRALKILNLGGLTVEQRSASSLYSFFDILKYFNEFWS